MSRIEKVELTNMCMVYDEAGNAVVQNRVSKKWGGITFPGGHIEKEESFTDAVIREIYEETGLCIENPQLCGVKQWNEEDGSRYIVMCYKSNKFTGELVSSDEGEVLWMKIDDLYSSNLANGMDHMLQLFVNENVSEQCFIEEAGEWKSILK